MKNKNILYLITKSNYGGAQKYTYELAKEASAKGALVTIIAGGTGEKGAPSGRLFDMAKAQGIKCHFVNSLERNMSFAQDCKSFIEIYQLIKKIKPDILHTSSSKAGGIGVTIGRLLKIERIIFTSHGLTMDENWRPWWQRMLITITTWLTVILAHKTIVLSSDDAKRLRKLPFTENKIAVIPNGIAETVLMDKKAARKKLNLKSTDTFVGGVGELHINKNWKIAIEALNQLPQKVHLLIIGEGEERISLQKLAENLGLTDRVHLLGYQTEAAALLPALDIFILPSLKEGLPYVLLEAGLAKLPVVASDLPGIRTIIDTGENGLLVEPTYKNIAVATEMLVRDPALGRKLGENLYHTVTSKFTQKNMARRTFSLYCNC